MKSTCVSHVSARSSTAANSLRGAYLDKRLSLALSFSLLLFFGFPNHGPDFIYLITSHCMHIKYYYLMQCHYIIPSNQPNSCYYKQPHDIQLYFFNFVFNILVSVQLNFEYAHIYAAYLLHPFFIPFYILSILLFCK